MFSCTIRLHFKTSRLGKYLSWKAHRHICDSRSACLGSICISFCVCICISFCVCICICIGQRLRWTWERWYIGYVPMFQQEICQKSMSMRQSLVVGPKKVLGGWLHFPLNWFIQREKRSEGVDQSLSTSSLLWPLLLLHPLLLHLLLLHLLHLAPTLSLCCSKLKCRVCICKLIFHLPVSHDPDYRRVINHLRWYLFKHRDFLYHFNIFIEHNVKLQTCSWLLFCRAFQQKEYQTIQFPFFSFESASPFSRCNR